MRFVRNSAKREWGLGVVAGEDAKNLDILFDEGGYHKVAKTFPGLQEIADADVPPEHRLRKREDWPEIDRDGKRAEAKRNLPKRFDTFIREFAAHERREELLLTAPAFYFEGDAV